MNKDLRVVVVYPDDTEGAINEWRKRKGLGEVPSQELKFGLDELQRVVNPLRAELITGNDATIYGLLNILSGTVHILWIITHGVEEGFFLNDGLVNASELTSLLRSAGTFLCVLNTCESYETAYRISSELDIALLCTVAPVPDRTAFISGTLFARHLAAGQDYVTAWEKAKPGQEHPYQLFQARRAMIPRQTEPKKNQSLEEAIHHLENTVNELKRVVYGYPELQLPPLRQLVNELTRDMAKIQDQLKDIQKTQTERSRIMWVILVGLIGIGIAVLWLVFRT